MAKKTAASQITGTYLNRPIYPDTSGQMYIATDTNQVFIGIGLSWILAGDNPDSPPPASSGVAVTHIGVLDEIMPLRPYQTRLGSQQNKFAAIYAGELVVDNIVVRESSSTVGGRILVGSASTVLTRDLEIGDTTIYIKHDNISNGDILYLESDGRLEFLTVTGSATASSELLSNTGFETAGGGGADVWDSWDENAGDGALADEGSLVHGGSHACKATAGTLSNTYVKQSISVEYNRRYKISIWSRGDGTYSGRFMLFDDNSLTDIIPTRSCDNSTTTYKEKIVYFDVPYGCNSVTLYLYCPSTDTGISYFDDISITLAEYSYTVTRNTDGSGENQWYAGESVFSTGSASGDGFIDIYSERGILSASEVGPTIVGNVRLSSTYDDWVPHWAIGNLNGLYGYAADTYGVALGKYGGDHIVIDADDGIRFRDSGDNVVGQLGTANWTLGNTAYDHVAITTGGIQLKDGGTVRMDFQTDGDVFIGSDIGSPDLTYFSIFANAQTYNSESVEAGDMLIGDNSSSKANMFWDKSAGELLFRGGTVDRAKIDTDGYIVGGSGAVRIGEDGIRVIGTTGSTLAERYRVVYDDSGTLRTTVDLFSDYQPGTQDNNITWLIARRSSGVPWGSVDLYIRAYDAIAGLSPTIYLYGTDNHIYLDTGADAGTISMRTGTANLQGSYRFYSPPVAFRSSTDYEGYLFVPLDTPLTSTNWDIDAYSTTAKTAMSLYSEFGAPYDIRAALFRVAIRDSGAATADCYLFLSPENTPSSGPAMSCAPIADRWNRGELIVPCIQPGGTIYYQIGASGTDTFDVSLQIWGYWL